MSTHQPRPGNSRGAWVDLHTHTNASDGSLRPSEVVAEASRIGLGALGITDHDTLEGLEEALYKGKSLGVWVIPGVEISVNVGDGRSFHLLGYGVEPDSFLMQNFLKSMRESRADRNRLVMERLARLGYPLEERDLEKPISLAGRPHLAMAMLKKGYVGSAEEAFARFLGKNGKAYVPRRRPSYEEAIEAVLKSGGVPVLAHPHTAGCQDLSQLEKLIDALVDCGLMGVETLYPEAPAELEGLGRELARRRNLLLTGGSDYHGLVKPHISLGFGRGTLRVPLERAESLHKAIQGKRGLFS